MESLARLYKALGDLTRLKLIRLLAEDEFCVCELAEILPCSQSGVSQHLAKLKAAGLVRERRDGHWTYYRLAAQSGLPAQLASAFDEFLRRPLGSDPDMAQEAERLARLDRAHLCRAPGRTAARRGAADFLPTIQP